MGTQTVIHPYEWVEGWPPGIGGEGGWVYKGDGFMKPYEGD